MVTSPPDPSSREPPPLASPAERIHAARYVLILGTAALAAASLLWDVPVAYSAGAVLLLILVAGFMPRRRAALRSSAVDQPPLGPDSSITAILQALPRPGFILDAAGSVRHANSRAAHLFPATRPGDPFTFTFRSPAIGEALAQAQAGREDSVDFHEPGETSNAYSVSLSPLGPVGELRSLVLVTFDDVSDRLAIARMRADFVANASHELRTPLASLTGFIETLLGPARNDPQATEKFLRIMLDQARRMRRLIDDLLSLSRLEMRVHRRPTEPVDLVPLLHQVADALGPVAREHSVALGVAAPNAPVEVIGERDELFQVFQNLIENGIRYGASGGRVDVSIETSEGQGRAVVVHVEDYGPGIPPEHLPRLTERFYRVEVGASRQMKGTGLGLAIVKHILTRHSGRLDVKSEPGKGACFTVELPLRRAEPREEQEVHAGTKT